MDLAPRLEVFVLNSALSDTLDVEKLDRGRGVTAVAVGSSRRVRVDVTDVIRRWSKTPSSNLGLAIGALTGSRSGRFTLKSGVLGTGVVGRLVVHYEPL